MWWQTLYGYGARRILVFGAPPIGCVPSQRTVAGGPTRECVARFNDASKLFNTKLSANIDVLSRTLRDPTIIYIDIYSPLLDLILNPHQYGNQSLLLYFQHIFNIPNLLS